MDTELIIVREYCRKLAIEPGFIDLLWEEGLIDVDVIDEERYLHVSQLRELEQYINWHYDLSINIAGIGTIRHLLDRMTTMQQEIMDLRNRLSLFDHR